ncbi:MAG: hypothetical protein KBA33_11005, partial [Cloacibacterium sp.]|nr:hypothetical protein [Cloacibacterium sp.]
MYQYINNILSIPARLLYEDWKVMKYKTYLSKCHRRQLIRTREGKGEGNEAMLSYYELPNDLKELCKEKLGDPNKEGVVLVNFLEDYIVPDTKAASFFVAHTKPDGSSLKPKEQRVKTTNCCIFNAIKSVLEDKRATGKVFGKQRTMIW